jgi:hypothetical protein
MPAARRFVVHIEISLYQKTGEPATAEACPIRWKRIPKHFMGTRFKRCVREVGETKKEAARKALKVLMNRERGRKKNPRFVVHLARQ